MNFYTLPLIINDRRAVITQLNEINAFSEDKSFIIETNDLQSFHLLSINKESIFKTFVEGNADLNLTELEPECKIENKHIILSFSSRKKVENPFQEIEKEEIKPLNYDDLENYNAKKKEVAIPKSEISKERNILVGQIAGNAHIQCKISEHGSIHLIAHVNDDLKGFCESAAANIEIVLQLAINNSVFLSKIQVSLAHPEQFLGMALDFGSESSQMAVKRYANAASVLDKRPEVENLFQNILSFHKAKGWIEKEANSSFYQEEINTNYYKSIFFLKADLSGDYEDIDQDAFIKNRKEDLKMLVNTHDGYTTLTQQKFHQLPNLKITHRYNDLFSKINFNIQKSGYDINISLGDIKNKVYNSILRVIIESFLKKEFLRYNNIKRKIRFILLVPNIYDFNDIKATQSLLNSIFKEFAANEYAGKLLAWEILTISESDASLLGYVNKNDSGVKKNKDYVIVDAGKGTTDLSIIRTGHKNVYNIQPVYRNGFAGAGNLITYAIFETILHHIRATASSDNAAFKFIREKIIAVLNSNDLERKNQFYIQLERLKYHYKKNTPAIKAQWQNAKTGDIKFRNLTDSGTDISSLTDLLGNIENIGDFYGYIKGTCEMIADRVVSNIKLIQENQEDFDCGGILLTGRGFLFEPLAEEVSQGIKNQLHLSLDLIDLLQGNELKDICVKGVFNNAIRLNSEKIGYPIQVVFKEKEVVEEKPREQEKPAQSFQEKMLKLLFNDLNNLEKSKTVIATNKDLSLDSLFHSQILIGANRYKVIANTLQDESGQLNKEADITFTPKGYLVREKSKGIVKNILPLFEIFENQQNELGMVIPSLFPNYIDDRFLYSIKRDDIVKAPIIPDPPAFKPTMNNEDNKPKGPIYF